MKQLTHHKALEQAMQDSEFKTLWQAQAIKREITKEIIAQRIKKNLSQAQLAVKAGLKQPSLARVEAGDGMPSLTTLAKIAEAFGARLRVSFSI